MKTYLLATLCCLSSAIVAQNLETMSVKQLDSMVLYFYQRQEFEKAIPYAEATAEKSKGADSTYAVSLGFVAIVYKQLGQYEKAEPIYLKAIEIYKNAYGNTLPEYASLLNNLGSLYQEIGNYDAAIPLFSEASKIWAKTIGENHPNYATVVNNLAYLYLSLGRYEDAESLFLQSKEIRRKNFGENHEIYAQSLLSVGLVYYRMGHYENAESIYLQVIEIYKKTIGEQHPAYAYALNNLATLYQSLGKYDAAVPLFSKTVDIIKNTLGEKHPEYAGALNNLGSIYYKMGQYEENEKLLLKVLELDKQIYGQVHSHYALSLNNLGTTYTTMKKYDKAKQLYLQAIEIWEKIQGKNHLDYSLTLNNLARLHQKTKEYKISKNYVYQAIINNCKDKSLDTSALDKNLFVLVEKDFFEQESIVASLIILYEINKAQYKSLGDKTFLYNAYTVLQVGMQINEKLRNNLHSEEDKLHTLRQMSGLVANAIQGGLELSKLDNKTTYLAEIFSYAEQNKSILLADATKAQRARVFGDLPDSLAQYEIALQQKKKVLEKKEVEATTSEAISEARNAQNDLNVEIKNFKKELESKYNKYYKLKYDNITATVGDVQKLIDSQTAFLEYFVIDSMVYLFLITKKDLKLFPFKINKTLLDRQISDFRKSVSDYKYIKTNEKEAYEQYTKSAYWFYKELLEPALRETPNISSLMIVADGKLGHLPFEAFLTVPVQSEKSYAALPYLLRLYQVSYNYSATLFVDNYLDKERLKQKNASKSDQILAIAASYKNQKDLSTARTQHLQKLRGSLQDLPAAKEEVAALSQRFKGSFLQELASNEADFKKNAGEYGILHLAMHGLLHPHAPILSSLAFTENGDSTEDNFLEAWEITHLDLNAELVVLSACETGYGKFQQGEGVMSLARAFMYAGVPSLVVSMWQVNDASTAHIMQLFYENLAKGMDKAKALQEAKLDYIQTSKNPFLAHPAFWAPFVQLGDSKAIYLKTKGGWLLWGIGGVVLVFGGIFMMNRKKKNVA